MKASSIFTSIVHLFVILFVLGEATLFLMLFFMPKVRDLFIFLVNEPKIFLILGIAFLAGAFFLLCGLYFIHRGETLQVRVDSHLCEVEMNIISGYIQKYFNDNFPSKNIRVENVFFNDNKLEVVILSLPMLKQELSSFLNKSKLGISKILAEQFQYKQKFIININF